jgi:Uma2 family endonuclease
MNPMLVQRMTADEYLALGEGYPRTELIEGEVVVDQPRVPPQRVLRAAFRALDGWALAADGRGEVMWPLDVKLDERNVFGPDLLWYSEGRAFAALWPYPLPDLAVEVRSPSTWRYDVGAKMLACERAGLTELWLVDTVATTVIVCRRTSPTASTFDVLLDVAEGEQLTSPQLPGFALDVASLFAG